MKISFFKNKSYAEWLRMFFIAIFALAGIFLWLKGFSKPLYQDEGVFLAIGRGISEGKLPYIDFWDHKTPGIYFTWAVFYKLFGGKIIFYKSLVLFTNIITAYFVFKVANRLRKGSGSLAAAMFFVASVFFEGNYLIAEPFVALFLAITFYLVHKKDASKSRLFIAGILSAAAFLFKQTTVVSLIPIAFILLKRGGLKEFIYGFLALASLTAAWLFGNGLMPQFYEQAIRVNLGGYPAELLGKVFGAWFENFSRVWWLWLGAAGYFLLEEKKDIPILLLVLIPIPFFLVRHYPHYWLQILPFLAVVSAIGFSKILEKMNTKVVQKTLLAIGSIFLAFSLRQNCLWFDWVTKNLNQPKQIEEIRAAEEIESYGQGKILAENRFTAFYFYGEFEPLTKYLYLTEVNDKEGIPKTINRLKAEDVLVIWPTRPDYVYAKEIDRYIRENFSPKENYKELGLTIWQRN